jgi:hypothetical protein
LVLKEVEFMEAIEKSGKVKLTFEMELNKSVMDLVRQDIDMMMDLASQGVDIWRKNMGERRKHGHGLAMMHGQE